MRYVIKHPTQGFFTEMKQVKTVPILAPMDMVLHAGHAPVRKGDVIGHESVFAPQFEAFRPSQAAQFDTKEDALVQIENHPDDLGGRDTGGPEAFASCTVEESPGP